MWIFESSCGQNFTQLQVKFELHTCCKTFLYSSHLSLVVSDLLVELFAFHWQEVLSGQQDATFGCDGTGGVDVVPSNHTYSDAGTLALSNGLWYLEECQEKETLKFPEYETWKMSLEDQRDSTAPLPDLPIGLKMILKEVYSSSNQVRHCLMVSFFTETSFISDNRVNKKRYRQTSYRNGQLTIRKLFPRLDGWLNWHFTVTNRGSVFAYKYIHITSLIHAEGSVDLSEGVKGSDCQSLHFSTYWSGVHGAVVREILNINKVFFSFFF